MNYALAMSEAVHNRREIEGWERKGDKEINDGIEEASLKAKLVKMPSKLKAVIRFGYDEGIRARLGNRTFDDWIKEVFVHTQAHFKHPSLGTEVVFEVSSSLFIHFYNLSTFLKLFNLLD